LTQLFDMATPPAIDVITIGSAVADVAPGDLVATIATVQTANAYLECVAGATIAIGAPVGTATIALPHPLTGLPFSAAVVGTPIGTATGAADSFAVAAAFSVPVGIATGVATTVIAGPADMAGGVAGPFAATIIVCRARFAAVVSAPAGTIVGAAEPLAAAAVVGGPSWLSFCHIPKFSFQNMNHFSHKKRKISKRIHLF
jgi:hypothetical protein